jgi:hypothetical protein
MMKLCQDIKTVDFQETYPDICCYRCVFFQKASRECEHVYENNKPLKFYPNQAFMSVCLEFSHN